MILRVFVFGMFFMIALVMLYGCEDLKQESCQIFCQKKGFRLCTGYIQNGIGITCICR